MTKFYLVIVFYIHLESIVFLLMYNFQDSIGPDNVFYTVHTLYAVFDLFIVVCVCSSDRRSIQKPFDDALTRSMVQYIEIEF